VEFAMPDQNFEASIRTESSMDDHWIVVGREAGEEPIYRRIEMMKFIALGLATSVLGLSAAAPAYACGSGCGGGDGGDSCGMAAAPVATASAKPSRSYSYEPSGGMYRSQMGMRGGMSGGDSGNRVPHSAAAKITGR
jgi:hypothetical protein